VPNRPRAALLLGLVVAASPMPVAGTGVVGTDTAPLTVEGTLEVVADTLAADPVLVGAGDIATCGVPGDNRTADLIDAIPGRVFAAGDTVYPDGTARQFRRCYHPTWGRFRARTSPAVGNHEYHTPGARAYFDYFGSRAGPRGKGWYAYDLGAWRVYVLNSNCDEVRCGRRSAQVAWLRADLAANPRTCVAAVMHHPLVSSGRHGNNPSVRRLWKTLDAAGADVVLAGHDHDYERFAPLSPDGDPNPAGMRLFVVGTGGGPLRPFATVRPGSAARNSRTWGVLALTLGEDGYAWRFVPVEGKTWTDAGTAACR
jgi:hypothetical protein